MISALLRKRRQLAEDPVLRRWLLSRATGGTTKPKPFTAHRPPYLDGLARWPVNGMAKSAAFAGLPDDPPQNPVSLPLPGKLAHLTPQEADRLFDMRIDDLETALAVHRFAWLPNLSPDLAREWMPVLWKEWTRRYHAPSKGWAWHPYTAAERAINLLDFARLNGLPEPRDRTLEILAAHAPAIAERLEYFGEHYTSNHLSNNGRGLFRLGLALNLTAYADLGGRILLAEANRIFRASGILREGSTHYHLLVTRNYVDAWLAARAHGRPETEQLENIAARALAAARLLRLPGGMPLIGDISPDCAPDFLAGLWGDGADIGHGWTGLLAPSASEDCMRLATRDPSPTVEELGRDGWWRVDSGQWSSLWHVDPEGWPAMPGHAHQDMGSFEIHYGTMPLFVDPGRGAYGDGGEAAADVSGARHNGLLVDGADPYPRNRPYYSDAFRRSVCGDAPAVEGTETGLSLSHGGFSRLKHVGQAVRRMTFEGAAMHLADRVDGAGRHGITRRFHTPHRVEPTENGVSIISRDHRFELRADGDIRLTPSKRWLAYGESVPATTIEISNDAVLPFDTQLTVEAA